MGNKKFQVWLPLLLSAVLTVGMFLGYKLNKTGNKNSFFGKNNHTSLQEALDIIRLKYVDSLSLDSLESSAIKEMMYKLDPHSVYLPPVELKQANEELSGGFDGIGVQYNVFSDTVNIIYVFPNGPSEKAGLKIGDKVLAVDDSTLVGKVTYTRIRELIRGKRGSVANLTILRDGKPQKVAVTRGNIPVPSLEAAYMVSPGIGYMKLTKFAENSYREFMIALEELKRQGLKELIFDLRGNGGGYMNEAVEMIDEFLSGDKLIVYTEGVNSRREEYKGKRPGLFETGKLVVLVDELSASASEVVAGALQDWDRATIIGRRTFGKGLVQKQFPLSDGSALRLTVSRYYTPLGRSIQRPYDKGKKVYMDELWERYNNGEVFYADSNKITGGKQYTTPGGRILYGGGAIMPDVFVSLDTSAYPSFINKLFISGSFDSFVYQYYLAHQQQLNQYKTPAEYIQNYKGDNQIWKDFLQYTAKDSINPAALTAEQQKTLLHRLEAQLARFKWRTNGFLQVLNSDDTVFQKALEELKK